MTMKHSILAFLISACCLAHSPVARADPQVLHTYGNSFGYEVDQGIAIDMAKLRPLVPSSYTMVPASTLGFGGSDQGLLVIANFRGIGPTVDGKKTGQDPQVAIDVGILVVEPAEAAAAGVNIPGAFHLYMLAIYTDDAHYAASLQGTNMPIKFLGKIDYQREMDDATGAGTLKVRVPAKKPDFFSTSLSGGYAPPSGALNAAFWQDGRKGRKVVLQILDQPFRQGSAVSQIYTRPHSGWEALFNGGGFGPCANDPQTGYSCILAPALNFRFFGSVNRLLLIGQQATALQMQP